MADGAKPSMRCSISLPSSPTRVKKITAGLFWDSNGYREKRRQTLEHLAERLAKTVIRNQRATTLEPMNPYERRIIHAKVAEIDGVSSKSVGEDPYRKVVILPLDENGEPIPARRSRGRNNRNDNRNDRKGGYRNHGNGGNRKRNANPHRNREEEIPHKPTNFDDIMSTSFEKDYGSRSRKMIYRLDCTEKSNECKCSMRKSRAGTSCSFL